MDPGHSWLLNLWQGLAPAGFPSTDQAPQGGVELLERKEQLETGRRQLPGSAYALSDTPAASTRSRALFLEEILLGSSGCSAPFCV